MRLGFFRSFRLLPGVRLNIGRTGISWSVGVRGLMTNWRKGRTRLTASLPGTGLSLRHELRTRPPADEGGTGRKLLDKALRGE